MYNGFAVVNIHSLLRGLPTQFPSVKRVPRVLTLRFILRQGHACGDTLIGQGNDGAKILPYISIAVQAYRGCRDMQGDVGDVAAKDTTAS